jgi:hypothetical protein
MKEQLKVGLDQRRLWRKGRARCRLACGSNVNGVEADRDRRGGSR